MNNTRSRRRPAPMVGSVQRRLRRAAPLLCIAAAAAVISSTAGALAESGRTAAIDLARYRLVDLTHPFEAGTIYWPTSRSGFTSIGLARGTTPKGFFYAAGAFQAPEHGGTHMDAPSHFAQDGISAEEVKLENLIAPLAVLDVADNVGGNADYEIGLSDILVYETSNGPIRRGSIVVARTGWSSRWNDRRAYLGDDTSGSADNLHFPGFGAEAVRLLIQQRGVAAIGIDTASLDPGKSTDFPVHRLVAAASIPGFENLTDLDQVPARGALLMALPMKIKGGTGAPLRAVALAPR